MEKVFGMFAGEKDEMLSAECTQVSEPSVRSEKVTQDLVQVFLVYQSLKGAGNATQTALSRRAGLESTRKRRKLSQIPSFSVIDSSGKVGPGLFRGRTHLRGHYSQCAGISYAVTGRERRFETTFFK